MLDLGSVAPYQVCKLERIGVFNIRRINTLSAAAFDTPLVKENLSGGAVEITALHKIDDRRPAFVVKRNLVELHVVDGQLRISFVVRPLGVGVAFGNHELCFRGPVAPIVLGSEAAYLALFFL